MKKNTIKKIMCCVLAVISAFVLLAGCRANNGAEKRAEEIVAKVLTCSKESYEKFKATYLNQESVTGEGMTSASSIELYKNEYGDYLTDACIELMLRNRYFPVANSDLFPNENGIIPKEITITRSASKENTFDYTAKIFAEEKEIASVSGTIAFADSKATKADSFSLKIEK